MTLSDGRLILRDLSDVGTILQGMRERAGFTMTQAIECAKVPITIAYLSNLEAGRRTPSLAMLLALCNLYGHELLIIPFAAGDPPAAADEEAPPHVD